MLRKLIGVLLAITIIFALQACSQKPAPEDGCSFVQNAEQQRVSWGAQVPVVLYVDSSVPNSYYDAIHSAASTWNIAIGREVIRIGGWTNSNGTPAADGTNIIYLLKTWESDRANEQARTTVYWSGDRIYEADVRLNGKDFDFFWGEEAIEGRVDIESLVLHEFGHVLGLSHTETPQSVMVRSLPSAKKRRYLANDDMKSIRCEY